MLLINLSQQHHLDLNIIIMEIFHKTYSKHKTYSSFSIIRLEDYHKIFPRNANTN